MKRVCECWFLTARATTTTNALFQLKIKTFLNGVEGVTILRIDRMSFMFRISTGFSLCLSATSSVQVRTLYILLTHYPTPTQC